VGPSVPLLLVPGDEVAAEINTAAHIIRQSHCTSGAQLANCFVGRLGNCLGGAPHRLPTMYLTSHHIALTCHLDWLPLEYLTSDWVASLRSPVAPCRQVAGMPTDATHVLGTLSPSLLTSILSSIV